jgi:RND family efflux transporter MFP subunit
MRTAVLLSALAALLACNGPRPDAGSTASAGPSASVTAPAPAPVVETVPVVVKPLDAMTHLEGELTPYERVAIYARANGFVSNVLVDRGSRVKSGQLLLTIVAPELNAQRAEAQAKLQGDKATSERLKAASQTAGAVAGDEVERSQALVRADEARVESLRAMEQYLSVTAPFEGVITERDVHPGALVGPQGGVATPMLRLEQVHRLRLTVPVPEALSGAVAEGSKASFTVRTFPGAKFEGMVSRIAHSIDTKTRSMAVELDVDNKDGRLAPGMFADVSWPVKRTEPSLFVPSSAIVQATDKTFVARIQDGAVEQVPVQRGVVQSDLVEVFGALHDGDLVARRATEELRTGTRVAAHPAAAPGPSK